MNISMISRVSLSLGLLGLLGGCAANYSCPAPEGGMCKSVSEVYAIKSGRRASSNDKAPSDGAKGSSDKKQEGETRGFSAYPAALKPGAPLRREARVVRLWIAPWVDSKSGDYYDQSYLYTEIDRGAWLIQDRVRPPQSVKQPANEASPEHEVQRD